MWQFIWYGIGAAFLMWGWNVSAKQTTEMPDQPLDPNAVENLNGTGQLPTVRDGWRNGDDVIQRRFA